MKKNIINSIFLILLIGSLIYVSMSFSDGFINSKDEKIEKTAASKALTNAATEEVFSPVLGKSYLGFKEAIGFKESQNNYFVVNTFGYLGKYQFGRETLKMIGVKNTAAFLKNPHIQERAFSANASRNKWILRRDIKRFVGKKIKGITVTESGILAAAHLAGAGNVKKYLRSGGSVCFKDAFGTSISMYLKKFSGYNTNHIKPNRKAKVLVEALM